MQINIGCFYFIKDSFFDIIDDSELMQNKENGKKDHVIIVLKARNMMILSGLFLLVLR